jgi:hypothetical protein
MEKGSVGEVEACRPSVADFQGGTIREAGRKERRGEERRRSEGEGEGGKGRVDEGGIELKN